MLNAVGGGWAMQSSNLSVVQEPDGPTNANPPSASSVAAAPQTSQSSNSTSLSTAQESQINALAKKFSLPRSDVESIAIAMMKWWPKKSQAGNGSNNGSDPLVGIIAGVLGKGGKEIFGKEPSKSDVVDLINQLNLGDRKIPPDEAANIADGVIEDLNKRGGDQSEFSSLAHGASDAFGSLGHPIDALEKGNLAPALVDAGAVVVVGGIALASLPADALVAVGVGAFAGLSSLAAVF